MRSLITFAVVVVLAFLAIQILARKKRPDDAGPWPFYARKPMSPAEQILYFRLKKALPDHIVLAQVQLSRLLGVKIGNDSQAWLNRINRMSADFVVCNRDCSVLAVIELDDATHNKAHRQAADAKKDHALTAAGIKLHRWPAKMIPDESDIRAALLPISPALSSESKAA